MPSLIRKYLIFTQYKHVNLHSETRHDSKFICYENSNYYQESLRLDDWQDFHLILNAVADVLRVRDTPDFWQPLTCKTTQNIIEQVKRLGNK